MLHLGYGCISLSGHQVVAVNQHTSVGAIHELPLQCLSGYHVVAANHYTPVGAIHELPFVWRIVKVV